VVPADAGRIDGLNRILREQISGIRVIRAFVRDRYERERFAVANSGLQNVSLRVGRLMALMFPTVMLVMNAASGRRPVVRRAPDRKRRHADRRPDRVPELPDADPDVDHDGHVHVHHGAARRVCAERIMEVLDTEPTVAPPAKPVALPVTRGNVELKDVEFTYPGAEQSVVSGINLIARPGETTAVIGSTGSGKTTLINLVSRLFDATGGTWLIDGVDVRDLDPVELAKAIGLVPQKAYLFSGTVASNLRYGRPEATEEEMWHALEIAQARDFVEKMPEGLDSPIAQGGTTVSGGQRQRLAIARAVIHRPSSTCSTTASPPSTRPPTPGCGRARRGDVGRVGDRGRPAGQHHPVRRPHRRPRRGSGRRHRHPPRTHGRQRDVPRDRPVPAVPAGGGVSVNVERPTRPAGPAPVAG